MAEVRCGTARLPEGRRRNALRAAAAVSRSRRARLATRNTGDFTHPGLELVDPWAAPG
ncbi:hypothetical protein [Kineococcus sp. G2]|uniref:hypothetical protein n=1 Tax=Kineococcus sp. G2 TaxID=3127484 RepID=UPI00301E437F